MVGGKMLVPKFEIGQKVYAVCNTSDTRQKHVECDVCNSTGYVKVEGKEGNFTCPVCHGRTETEHYGYKYVIAYKKATIGRIQITEYAKKYRSCKSVITYMLQETGVGSGTLWNEERLFATEEEANEFCEKYISSDYYDQEAILRT